MNLFQQRDLLADTRKSASTMLTIATFITGLVTQSVLAMTTATEEHKSAGHNAINSGSTSNGPARQSAAAVPERPQHDALSPTEISIILTGSDKNGKEAKEKTPAVKASSVADEKQHVFQGKLVKKFEAHDVSIEQIMYIKNTACFATRAVDSIIKTWSWDALFNPTPEDPLERQSFLGFMSTCAILSDTLIAAPDRGNIYLLYPRTGTVKQLSIKLPRDVEKVTVITLPKHYIAIPNPNGAIQIYHHYTLERTIITDQFIEIMALDQTHVATLSNEAANIWNIQTGERILRIILDGILIRNIGMAALTNNRIVLCEDNIIFIWNWKRKQIEAKVAIDTSYIPHMTELANGDLALVAATGTCTKLYVWNLQTTRLQYVDTVKGRVRISCIARHPNNYLFAGCTDGSVLIYG